MSALPYRGADAYRKNAVETATPAELVVMLYDGALRFAAEARDATLKRDIKVRSAATSRLLAIVGHLQSTLDLERGGALAESLDGLYTFVTGRIMDAAFSQSVEPIDEAVRVLTTLREGWVGISTPGSDK